MAQSRVQKGWDFTDGEGRRVQVRYLSNPAGPWVNEHLVDFRGDGCDRYALVLFEALDLVAMIVFDREGLERVCAALKKRHPRQDLTLQFTSANYRGSPPSLSALLASVFGTWISQLPHFAGISQD